MGIEVVKRGKDIRTSFPDATGFQDRMFPVESVIEAIRDHEPLVAGYLDTSHGSWQESLKKGYLSGNKKDGYRIIGSGMPGEQAETVRRFLTGNSGTCRVVWGKGGGGIYWRSWHALDYIYRNVPAHPDGGDPYLDHVLLNTRASRGIRNRFDEVVRIITDLARKECENGNERFTISNLGSGPGLDTMTALRRLREEGITIGRDGISAECFDISKKAIRTGMKMAEGMGVSDAVMFNRLDIADMKRLTGYPPARIALMIGLLDYIPDSEADAFLRLASCNIEKGGAFVTSNIKPHDVGNHSIMGCLNWYLHERTEEEYLRILENAALHDVSIHTEPEGVFMTGIGIKS